MTSDEALAFECENCGNCVVCNPNLQLAESLKYSSEFRCSFGEIQPGLFALFGPDATRLYVGRDWNKLLEVYRNRPKYITKPHEITRKSKLGNIDFGKLEIRI